MEETKGPARLHSGQVLYSGIPIFLQEGTTMDLQLREKNKSYGSRDARYRRGAGSPARYLMLLIIAAALIAVPVAAGGVANASGAPARGVPQVVHISAYMIDFSKFSVEDGSVDANFYLHISSDSPISLADLEIMNGKISSVNTLTDTPLEKEYRVYSVLTMDPNLRRYPFDRHIIPLEIEPHSRNEREMVLVIDRDQSGLDHGANLPGWEFTGTSSIIHNETYSIEQVPYSRAVFLYGIERDGVSTILKFFLPVMLIIIVSLSSLMMKVSSRLGLNASMFLAAVLIHWRVADAIPLVAYTTFLDVFMIITYGTLVMVLISGILILKFAESKDTARVDKVNYWSLRIIPPVCITLYFLLFLSLAFK